MKQWSNSEEGRMHPAPGRTSGNNSNSEWIEPIIADAENVTLESEPAQEQPKFRQETWKPKEISSAYLQRNGEEEKLTIM